MEFDKAKMIPAIVTIVGALLCVIALFIAWLSGSGENISGTDFLKDASDWKELVNGIVPYIPLIALILGVIAAILAVVGLVGVELPDKVEPIAYIVLGLIVLILVIVFIMAKASAGGVELFQFKDHLGVGVWLSLIGGILIALNGVLEITGVYSKLA